MYLSPFYEMGYSVIPVKQNKKPDVDEWTPYQSKPADQEQIRQWWRRKPGANIGIVTGEISGFNVVDVDSKAGRDAVNEFLPDSLTIPTVKTPKGLHFYFEYSPGLINSTKVIRDTDIRTDGGYIIAPPSKTDYWDEGKHEGGPYEWMQGLRITEVKPPPMPDMLFDILESGATSSRALASIYNKDSIPSLEGANIEEKDTANNRQHVPTIANIGFEKGIRDNTLFHLANHLVRGGMPFENIRIYLEFIARNCTPPFPEKEIQAKILSALKRAENKERNLTQEIRELICQHSGNISLTFAYICLQLPTREERKKVQTIFGRMAKEGLIERTGRTAGEYRIIEADCEPKDWQNSSTDTVDLWLPFELGDMVEVMPGDIILIAGSQNAGKSALLMNIAKES
jgi:hypothetical protein